MPGVTLTIGVATCAKFVAEYLGLIESATENTSKLRHEPLKSAINWFNHARTCDKDKKLMQTYLDDARHKFMEAISLEDDENKIAAIVGLCMCQKLLGDEKNARINMQKIKDVELTKGAIMRATAKFLLAPPLLREVLITRATFKRTESFETFKNQAIQFNDQLLALPK